MTVNIYASFFFKFSNYVTDNRKGKTKRNHDIEIVKFGHSCVGFGLKKF